MAPASRPDSLRILLSKPVRQRRLPLLYNGPHEEPTWQQLTAKLEELQHLVISRGRRVLLPPALELQQLCKGVADLCLAEERCLELLVASAHQLSPCHLDCLLRGLEMAGAFHLADYLRLNQCITPRDALPVCQGVIPGCPHLPASATPSQAGTPRPAGSPSDALALSQQLDTLRALRSARNDGSGRPRVAPTSGNWTPKAGGALLEPVPAARPSTPATPIAFREQRYLFLAACSDVVGKCDKLEIALHTMDPGQPRIAAETSYSSTAMGTALQTVGPAQAANAVQPPLSIDAERRLPMAEPLQSVHEESVQPDSVSVEQLPGADTEQQMSNLTPTTMPKEGKPRAAADPLGRDPFMDFLQDAAFQCSMHEPTALLSPEPDSRLPLLRLATPDANLDAPDMPARLDGLLSIPDIIASPEANLTILEKTDTAAPTAEDRGGDRRSSPDLAGGSSAKASPNAASPGSAKKPRLSPSPAALAVGAGGASLTQAVLVGEPKMEERSPLREPSTGAGDDCEAEKTPSQQQVSTPRAPAAPSKSGGSSYNRMQPSPAVRSLTQLFNGCNGAVERARQMGGQFAVRRRTPQRLAAGSGAEVTSATSADPRSPAPTWNNFPLRVQSGSVTACLQGMPAGKEDPLCHGPVDIQGRALGAVRTKPPPVLMPQQQPPRRPPGRPIGHTVGAMPSTAGPHQGGEAGPKQASGAAGWLKSATYKLR
ncbi:hypothetical protein N2152v2_010316 [Parachlorella kessleri]